MFTGLVEGVGEVSAARRDLLTVRCPAFAGELRAGDSVSVSGACLTVTEVRGEEVSFDLSEETLQVTTLGEMSPGDRVNLEGALKVGDRMGGHMVQGHVDGVAVVTALKDEAQGRVLTFRPPKQFMGGIAPKGSIAVDGVSLAVASISVDEVTVALIPYTLTHTTLGASEVGDRVNIETDVIAKYVARYLSASESGGVTEELLERHGFK